LAASESRWVAVSVLDGAWREGLAGVGGVLAVELGDLVGCEVAQS
jgi:hypothetical protein